MEYRNLGWSGIRVSPLCVGGMSFGEHIPGGHQWTCSPTETEAVIGRAWELGINYIDTANCYAAGTSEEYIGRALKKLDIPREKVVLQSKVFFNKGALSPDALQREIDGSLARLGTDYLDVYMIHRFDYDTPVEETMEALHELVKAGKVRALGASEMYAYQFHTMQIVAEQHGWTPFTVMQNHYNLLYREDERELIPLCRQLNVALTSYSPLASGHLTRTGWHSDSVRSRTDGTMRQKYRARPGGRGARDIRPAGARDARRRRPGRPLRTTWTGSATQSSSRRAAPTGASCRSATRRRARTGQRGAATSTCRAPSWITGACQRWSNIEIYICVIFVA